MIHCYNGILQINRNEQQLNRMDESQNIFSERNQAQKNIALFPQYKVYKTGTIKLLTLCFYGYVFRRGKIAQKKKAKEVTTPKK